MCIKPKTRQMFNDWLFSTVNESIKSKARQIFNDKSFSTVNAFIKANGFIFV